MLALGLIGAVALSIFFRIFVSSSRHKSASARTSKKSRDAQSRVESALIQAAKDNSKEATKKILANADVTWKSDFSCHMKDNRWHCNPVTKEHPISYAATLGHTAIVDLLLHAGADIEYKDSTGQTPLVLAAKGNHLQTCCLLVARGADIQAHGIHESKGVPSRTAISFAWLNKNEKILDLFLQSLQENAGKRSVEYIKGALATFMCHAAIRNDLQRMKYLISLGADVNNQRSESTTTVLCIAARHADLETVKFLLIAGANPNATVERRSSPTKGNITGATTPLESAVVNKEYSKEIAQLLIRSGAVPTRSDLEFAQAHGSPEVIKMLESKFHN
ncbi:ankyrin [Penicillium taxi]|uniref:ankyrin n=1 Tax=Penicillium taxi TaxID=168475 RepID=UPI002544F6A5|nr:ankyrin [Penicillium taxi]KAJ5908079.1 ankyrin [Penicillium taxi]